jgi:hypothetical protein
MNENHRSCFATNRGRAKRKQDALCLFKSVFYGVVVVAFQITFHAEIHVNDFFYFLKIIFNISILKRSKKYKPHSILTKKKI